jgi:polyphosphate kinase 2
LQLVHFGSQAAQRTLVRLVMAKDTQRDNGVGAGGFADRCCEAAGTGRSLERLMSKQDLSETQPRMKRKKFEKELRKLQTELCLLQEWVVHAGLRVIIVFEGRDAAGKGGTIKAITERVSPRVFRLVALPAPSDRQKTQLYVQRYMQHFPAAGEVIIFDRSWYNRAGVEHVMGFCTKEAHQQFLENCPKFESHIVASGILLIKFWLEVGQKEQRKRFEARINDPLRQWKLSPMDLESYARWYAYSRARDLMLEVTDTKDAPWYIVPSDDKRRARLNCISHLLRLIPYKERPREKVKLPKRKAKGAYDDQATLAGRTFVPEEY